MKNTSKMWAGVKMDYTQRLDCCRDLPGIAGWCTVRMQFAAMSYLRMHHGCVNTFPLTMENSLKQCYVTPKSCPDPGLENRKKKKCRYNSCTKQSPNFRHLLEHITKTCHSNPMALLAHISKDAPLGHFTAPPLASQS